jgi:large subunit ribosomal protein L32
MAVPKKKTSTSKRNQRRSHDGLTRINYGFNKTTGELQLPHQVSTDGYYNGKKVIKEKVKKVAEGEVVPDVPKLDAPLQALEAEAPEKAKNKDADKKAAVKSEKKAAPKKAAVKSEKKDNKKDSDKSEPKKS